MNCFSEKSKEELEYYVYVLIDPRDNQVFYVGKGTGDRVFAHHGDDTFIDTEKIKRIIAIESEGYNVVRKIVNYKLTEEEAFASEASLINFIGINNLTNIARGHKVYCSYSVEEFENENGAEKIKIVDSVLVIKINSRWHRGISEEDVYNATRYCWRISDWRLSSFKYVFGVYRGLIKGVYIPAEWVTATKETIDPITKDRYEGKSRRKYFVGVNAPEEIQNKYLNKDISEYFKKGEQTPIRYIYITDN